MIHTFTITHRFSKEKLLRQFTRVWTGRQIKDLLSDQVKALELQPYSLTGINSFKVYGGGDMYLLSVTVNPQALITQQNTISVFDCSPEAIKELKDNFNAVLDYLSLTGFRDVTEWYAERVDFALNVTTENVPRYVKLAKMENRPAWYVDKVDMDGSAYPESKSVTINFYDKADEVYKTLFKVPDFDRLLAEAHNIFRLEIQCGSDKLKSLQRKTNNDLRLRSFLHRELALSVVVGYYKKLMGYQDFCSISAAKSIVEDYCCCGASKKRNFISWIENNARFDTLPEAKTAFLKEKRRSSWYNFMKTSREMNINPVAIPAEWDIDRLTNPLPSFYRI